MWEVLGDGKLGNFGAKHLRWQWGDGSREDTLGGGSRLSQERSQGEGGHWPPCRGSVRFRKAPQKEEFLNKAEGKQISPLHHLCQPPRLCTGLWARGGTGTKTQHELHPKLLTAPQDRSPCLAGMLPGHIPKEMPALM